MSLKLAKSSSSTFWCLAFLTVGCSHVDSSGDIDQLSRDNGVGFDGVVERVSDAQVLEVDDGTFETRDMGDATMVSKIDSSLEVNGVDSQLIDVMPPDGGTRLCTVNEAQCNDLSDFWVGEASTYPIVLVHGFMGWDQRWWLDYFFDIPSTLHDAGYSVFVAALDPVSSSDVRSVQLLNFVNAVRSCSCAEKVNLIGHSQGGLDARMLIGPHQQSAHVASITTISSPHRGFSLADDVLASRGLGPAFFNALTVLTAGLFLGEPLDEADLLATLDSMSVETRTQYNLRYPDPPGVPIYSYAGFTGPSSNGLPDCAAGEMPTPERGDLVEPALLVLYGLLGGRQVPNDGVVPVSACIWGRFLGCLAADHWDQIGQAAGLSDRFDFREFYLRHAQFLSQTGL